MKKQEAKIRIRQLLKIKTIARKKYRQIFREKTKEEFFEMMDNRKSLLWYWVRKERKLTYNLLQLEEYY